MPVHCIGAVMVKDFPWPMFLPALTGEVKICTSGPQTVMWGGLEWQRCDDGHEQAWQMANDYCQSSSLGKKSDWRLPTKGELKSLVVCTNGNPVPLADYQWCGDIGTFASPTIDSSFQSLPKGYWTSTLSGTTDAWFVNFLGGNAEIHSLQNGNYVRCVRTP